VHWSEGLRQNLIDALDAALGVGHGWRDLDGWRSDGYVSTPLEVVDVSPGSADVPARARRWEMSRLLDAPNDSLCRDAPVGFQGTSGRGDLPEWMGKREPGQRVLDGRPRTPPPRS